MLELLLFSIFIRDRDGGAERPCSVFTDDPGWGETVSVLEGEQGRSSEGLKQSGRMGQQETLAVRQRQTRSCTLDGITEQTGSSWPGGTFAEKD